MFVSLKLAWDLLNVSDTCSRYSTKIRLLLNKYQIQTNALPVSRSGILRIEQSKYRLSVVRCWQRTNNLHLISNSITSRYITQHSHWTYCTCSHVTVFGLVTYPYKGEPICHVQSFFYLTNPFHWQFTCRTASGQPKLSSVVYSSQGTKFPAIFTRKFSRIHSNILL